MIMLVRSSDQHKAYVLTDVSTIKGCFHYDVLIDENSTLFQHKLDHKSCLKITNDDYKLTKRSTTISNSKRYQVRENSEMKPKKVSIMLLKGWIIEARNQH